MSTLVSKTQVAALATVAFIAISACSRAPSVALSAPIAASVQTGVGAAPVLAMSPLGMRALAWVSAPDSGTDGRLYVSVNDQPPVEIRDTIGPIQARGESPPKLAFDNNGALHALFVVGKEVPGRKYPMSAMRHVVSVDSGRTWSTPESVTDVDTFGSFNFQALHVSSSGVVYASWLDGREGKSATYMTRSTDGGHTWAANQRVAAGQSCPCCRTAIASDDSGNVYMAWRSVLDGNVRDIVVSHSSDNGVHFDAPVRVHADNWVFNACPEAGPSIQVDNKGKLHVAWWTGKDGIAGVYYAQSTDRAKTFSDPTPLGVAEFSKPSHVALALGDSGMVAAAWDDGTLAVPAIVLRVSGNGGRSFSKASQVSSDGRAAAYPMLSVRGKTLSLAWSERSPELAARAEHEMQMAMKDKTMKHGLTSVGDTQVMMRSGTVQ